MDKHLPGKFSEFRDFQASRAALRMTQFNAEEPAIRNSFQNKSDFQLFLPTLLGPANIFA